MINEKVTRKQRQERAKLYASLASKESLEGLSPKEQRALFSSVRRAKYPWLDFVQRLARGVPDPELNLPPPYNLVGYEKVDWKQVLQEAMEGKSADRETEEARIFASRHHHELARLKKRWVRKETRPGLPSVEEIKQAKIGWTPEAYTALCWEALRRAYIRGAGSIPTLASGGEVGGNPPWSTHKIRWKVVGRKLQEFYVGVVPEDEILFDLIETLKEPPFPFGACPICETVFVRNRKQKYCSRKCTADSQKAPVRGESMRKTAKAWRQRKAKERKAKAA